MKFNLPPSKTRERSTTERPRLILVHTAEQEPASRRVALALFLLGSLTAALWAFVIYPRQGAVTAIADLNGFGALGRHIAAGDGFSLGSGPTLRRAPLYSSLVALLLKIFGNDGPENVVYRPVFVAQCLVVGVTCVTAWAIGRRLFGERAGVLAGILCAVTPQVLRYVAMTEVETLMGLLIALMTLTGLNLYRRPVASNGVLFGLACGAATLVKAIAMLYAPALLILCLIHWRKARALEAPPAPLPAAGAALGVFLLCLLPWSVRNMIVSGGQFKSVSSNGPGEFLRGYVNAEPQYAFLKKDFGGTQVVGTNWDWDANLMEDELLRRNGMSFFSEKRGEGGQFLPMESRIDLELKKERIESAEAKRRVIHEPGGFVRKFVTQVFTFWYIVETRKKSLQIGAIALFFLALAGFGYFRARRSGIDPTPVVATVLYFNLLYAAFLAFARYSMPVYPVLLTLAAYGITELLPKSKTRPTLRRGIRR